MGWLKSIFGSKKDDRLERLVRRLIFYQDAATFRDALREATELAPKGDDFGIRALSEAIRRRCGGRNITFYSPSSFTIQSGDVLFEAEDRLLELAKSNKLLDDPSATQDLISAALVLSQDGLQGLEFRIFANAGVEQCYDFHLLFNQMHSSVKLWQARGELTQQMTEEAS